jgi:hypothetical protein
MCTLRIEHDIVDFGTWKAAFDRDPVGRRQSGVRSYRIFRPLDDERYVMIDLDFDAPAQAQQFLTNLQRVWSQKELSPGLERQGEKPRARILNEVVDEQY